MENHHAPRLADRFLTRRDFLTRCGMGMGGLALANLLGEGGLVGSARAAGSLNPLTAKLPPFPAKAKRIIHLFMNGGPSHVDTFDPKPLLDKYHGQPLPTAKDPTRGSAGT